MQQMTTAIKTSLIHIHSDLLHYLMFTYVLLYCLTTDVLKLNVKLGGAYRGGYGLPGLSPAGKYYRKS